MKALIPIIILTVIGVGISAVIHGGISLPKWSSDKPERIEPSQPSELELEFQARDNQIQAEIKRMLQEPTWTPTDQPPVNLKEARQREEAAVGEAIQEERQALGDAVNAEREALNRAIFEAAGEIP